MEIELEIGHDEIVCRGRVKRFLCAQKRERKRGSREEEKQRDKERGRNRSSLLRRILFWLPCSKLYARQKITFKHADEYPSEILLSSLGKIIRNLHCSLKERERKIERFYINYISEH